MSTNTGGEHKFDMLEYLVQEFRKDPDEYCRERDGNEYSQWNTTSFLYTLNVLQYLTEHEPTNPYIPKILKLMCSYILWCDSNNSFFPWNSVGFTKEQIVQAYDKL